MSARTSLQSQPPSAQMFASTSAAATPPVGGLAMLVDPPVRLMDAAIMDYFVIEMVETLRSSASVAVARSKQIEREMVEAGLIPAPPPPAPAPPADAVMNQRDSTGSLVSVTKTSAGGPRSGAAAAVVDEAEEAVRYRLELIGMHVGANFTERLCRDRPLFAETLDVIKFVCKDVWIALWDKQVDNLRTNHRGVYVLQDNAFKPISRLSAWEGRAEAIKRARLYTAMSAGIIRGVLSRLGMQATVIPEVTHMPQCTFQVKLPKNP